MLRVRLRTDFSRAFLGNCVHKRTHSFNIRYAYTKKSGKWVPAFYLRELRQLSQYSYKATCWTTGVRFPAGKGLSLRHNVHTGWGLPMSYAMGTGVLSSGRKRGSIPPLPHKSAWFDALLSIRDNCSLLLTITITDKGT
jgi:hypothetical protein